MSIGVGPVKGIHEERNLRGGIPALDDLDDIETAGDVIETVLGEVGRRQRDELFALAGVNGFGGSALCAQRDVSGLDLDENECLLRARRSGRSRHAPGRPEGAR